MPLTRRSLEKVASSERAARSLAAVGFKVSPITALILILSCLWPGFGFQFSDARDDLIGKRALLTMGKEYSLQKVCALVFFREGALATYGVVIIIFILVPKSSGLLLLDTYKVSIIAGIIHRLLSQKSHQRERFCFRWV